MNGGVQSTPEPTVLCVDDEQYVLKALERMLARYGCRVLLANNAGEALDLLEREKIEVLICDEAMPGTRGIEVMRQAKAISPNTARILLTAHCCDEDVVIPAVNEGEVFRLLSKPWEDDEVQQVVADALGLEPKEWGSQQQRVVQRLCGDAKGSGVSNGMG